MPKKVVRISRNDAANRVVSELRGQATLSELVEKANTIVVESGGPDNLKETVWNVRRALSTAEALGIVKVTRPTDVTIERAKG